MSAKLNVNTIQLLEGKIAQSKSIQEKIDALNNLAWQLRISQHERAQSLSSEAFELSNSGENAKKTTAVASLPVSLLLRFWIAN